MLVILSLVLIGLTIVSCSQVDRSPLIQDFLLLFLVGVCGSVAVVIGARRLFMRRSSMLAPRAVNIS